MAGASGEIKLTDGSYGITMLVLWKEIYNTSNGTSTIAITELKVKCSSYSGFLHYLDGEITINGKTAVSLSSYHGTHNVYVDEMNTFYSVVGSLGQVSGITRKNDGTDAVTIKVSINAYSQTSSGKRWGVSGSASAALHKTYLLTVNTVTGATVTVNRTSSPVGDTGNISNGEIVFAGDVLKISFAAGTGYNLGIHTVNGTTFTSGQSHTVNGGVSVAVSAILKTFKLAISVMSGALVTVQKGSTALSNGATITYGDKLTITFGAANGYIITSRTVNGSSFASGNTYTVTGNVTVAVTVIPGSYTVTIDAGIGTKITVMKGDTEIASGDEVNYQDVLTLNFEAVEGYDLQSHTANGEEIPVGGTYNVTEDVTIAATASLKQYLLTVSVNEGGTVTVERTSSGGGSIGQIQSGDVLYYGDVLTVNFADDEIHDVAEAAVNGAQIQTGTEVTVKGDVSVIVVFMLSGGMVFITVDGADIPHYVFIEDGSSWDLYEAYIDSGTEWILCDE